VEAEPSRHGTDLEREVLAVGQKRRVVVAELSTVGLEHRDGVTAPPRAATLWIGPKLWANRIVSSGPQTPAGWFAGATTSQITSASPPLAEIRFNLPCAKKAIAWPSGAQKGE
jgi:hypothetical protein